VTGSSVLVLGAAGFIGRHVSRELAAQGFTVHGLGHGLWDEAEWRAWGLGTWTCDDLSATALGAAVMRVKPTAVLHCAGSGSVASSYERPYDDFNRSVTSVAALAEAVRRHAAPETRVVVTSSAAIYGDQGDVDLTEAATRSPISPYGFHKAAAETLCDSYARFFGVKVSIVRLFSVYGEGLRKQLLWDAMNKFARGERQFFGTGHEVRDWIHAEDAARLLCAAATSPQAQFEIYNGGHQKVSTREVLTSLASAANSGLLPEFSGETHTGNPRRLTSDCSHARRQLGWEPHIALADGLARYVRWYRQHGAA